jgi:anti-sigma B factor antagonist
MSDGALRPVHVVGLPLDVRRRASEHGETLRRELAFVEHASDPEAAPARLHQLSASLTARFGALTAAQDAEATAAQEAGQATIDLVYHLPLEVADACDDLAVLLDELDDFCREGDLLTLVTPPEAVAFRRWFLDEVREQLREGRGPRPWAAVWPATDAAEQGATAPPATAAPAPPQPHEAPIVVTDDLDLALAPALREEIVRRTEAGATDVVVDLSRCGFLDSTGLSLLLTTHLRLSAAGGGLRIVGATAQVAGILEMSGVRDLLVDAGG